MVENEKLLEKNMIIAKIDNKPSGYRAFHIVSSPQADAVQTLLLAKIDINAAHNGVYVSEVVKTQLNADINYSIYINKAITKAYRNKNKADLESTLNNIRQKISNGDLNWK